MQFFVHQIFFLLFPLEQEIELVWASLTTVSNRLFYYAGISCLCSECFGERAVAYLLELHIRKELSRSTFPQQPTSAPDIYSTFKILTRLNWEDNEEKVDICMTYFWNNSLGTNNICYKFYSLETIPIICQFTYLTFPSHAIIMAHVSSNDTSR